MTKDTCINQLCYVSMVTKTNHLLHIHEHVFEKLHPNILRFIETSLKQYSHIHKIYLYELFNLNL